MSALIGWNNLIKSSVISANSAATNFPASNVATDQGSPSAGWQTAAGVVTLAGGALISAKPATLGQTWRVIGLFGTNITAAATVNFALWDKPLAPVLVWTANIPGPVSGYGQVVAVLPVDTVADSVQIYIDDPTNPDGFINVATMFAGPAWQPIGSTGFDSTVGRDESVAEVVTRGGQEYPALLWQRRRWDITFDSLRQSETWGIVDPMFRQAKAGANVFFTPDGQSPNLQQEAIFGRLQGTADISYPYGGADRRRWQAQITERL